MGFKGYFSMADRCSHQRTQGLRTGHARTVYRYIKAPGWLLSPDMKRFFPTMDNGVPVERFFVSAADPFLSSFVQIKSRCCFLFRQQFGRVFFSTVIYVTSSEVADVRKWWVISICVVSFACICSERNKVMKIVFVLTVLCRVIGDGKKLILMVQKKKLF